MLECGRWENKGDKKRTEKKVWNEEKKKKIQSETSLSAI